jgi:nucleotide-binding universal stress UspA family protein
MTYKTLMVHLDLGTANDDLLSVTSELAARCHARVIGIAACQPMPLDYGDGIMSGDLMQVDRAETDTEVRHAEAAFYSALAGKASATEFRSRVSLTLLADYIAEQSRSADLIITAPGRKAADVEPSWHVDVGDLVLRAGRPVMIVPPGVGTLDLAGIVVGWKDTREARRAIQDALPLLQMAEHVTVVEIATPDEIKAAGESLRDVAGWLQRHGIAAKHRAIASAGDDAAQLHAAAADDGAGLLVAGAYGHSRIREWVFGGVSRDLLQDSQLCSLLSH